MIRSFLLKENISVSICINRIPQKPNFVNRKEISKIEIVFINKKRPLLISQQRSRCLDIESYFDVLPAVDSAAGGVGVEVLLGREGEGGKFEEVRS